MKKNIFLLLLFLAHLTFAQQQWVKNTFPSQGHIDNPGPWKTGQGSDRGEWVSAFGVSPVIPPGDDAPLMLQVSDLATLQFSSDGIEFKRANIPLTRGGAVDFNPHDGNVGYALMEGDPVLGLDGWWRTEDKGETWSFMFEAPTVRGQRNDLLEVHPNPTFKDHIYIAANTTNGNHAIVTDFSNYPIGLYRSTDNGDTWSVIDFAGEEVYKIRFNADASVLYVVTYAGGTLNDEGGNLYTLTFDANDATGTTYTKTLIRGNVRNMDADPDIADEGKLIDSDGDIYSFTNYGTNSSLQYNGPRRYRFVEINPSNNQHIIAYEASSMQDDPFIWSNDGGANWNLIEEDGEFFPTWFDYAPINYFSKDYMYKRAEGTATIVDGNKDVFAFWPGDPKRVLNWATNIRKGPLMSEDYGRTFIPFASGGSFKGSEGANLGDEVGVIGIAKNEYGFVLTKNNGVSWEGHSVLSSPVLNNIYLNHPNTRAFKRRNGNALDFNPENNDIIIGSFGISPTYIVRSEDFGKTWIDLETSFMPVGTETTTRENLRAKNVFWHNQNADIVYVGPMKSTDGGNTFSMMTGGHFVTDMHEKNGNVVLSLEFARLMFISYDAGETWGQLPVPPPSIIEPSRFVGVAAGDNDVAFDLRPEHDPAKGGRLRFLAGGENGVYEFLADAPNSFNGTWRLISNGFDLSDDPYHAAGQIPIFNNVSVDSREGHHENMYLVTGATRGRRSYYRQVYKSTDAGESWSKIASDDILGSPDYVSAQWSGVDANGNFIFSDWDGVYTYQGLATIETGSNFPERGSVGGSGDYAYTEEVNLTAQPNQGFRFGGWEENGEIVNTDANWLFYTFTSRNLTAIFEFFNAPVELTAKEVAPESMTITWKAPSDNPDNIGVSGFNVYLDGNLAGTTEESAFSLTGLTEGTEYAITVEAFGPASTSTLSEVLLVTTPIFDIVAPSVPTGLSSPNIYSTTAELVWQPSVDADAFRSGIAGYKVYLDGNLVDENVGGENFFFTGLNINTTYQLSVSAFDSVGNTSAISSSFSLTTTAADTEAPVAPSEFVAFDIDLLSVSVGWTEPVDNEFVTGYNVYLDGVLQGTTESTSFSFSGLRPDRSYNVEVEAFDLSGNTSNKGSFTVSTAIQGERIEVDTEEEILFFLPRLEAGDSLIIKDGVYTLGTPSFSNRQGTATAPIVIMSENLYGAKFTGNTRLNFINGDYLKFIGLSFENITQYTGLRLIGCNYSTIGQCSFYSTSNDSGNTGLRLESGSSGPTRNAYNTVENSLFEKVRFGSMVLMGNDASNVGGNIIKNNVYRNSSSQRGNAILMSVSGANVGNTIIEGNVFDSWTIFDAINVSASNITIRKNVFAQSRGVIIRRGNNNVFSENQLLRTKGQGIWLHGNNHIVINNTFDGGDTEAVRFTYGLSGRSVSRNNLVAYNTVVNNRGFTRFYDVGATSSTPVPNGNRILNNVASLNAGQYLRSFPSTGNTADYNILYNAGGAVPVTITANNSGENPLLGDAPYYFLGEDSPALGSGTAIPEVTTDFFGATRTANDRGHITYPSDISDFVSPYMFYPPNTSGNDALPLEAIFEQYNASETTGDAIMLDAIQSKGEFSKYRWTVSAYPSGAETVSVPIDESVYSFVFDDTQLYTIKLELLDEEGNVLAETSSELRGENVPISKLKLTSMCSENPFSERRWRVRNPNPFPVDYEWEVYGTDVKGYGTAEPGDSFFMAIAFSGANTTKLYWYNEKGQRKSTTKASGSQACDPNFVVAKLKLTSMCSDDPSTERRWRVRNTNSFSVKYQWEVHGTSQKATVLAPSGDSFFFTSTVGGANTTKIKWQNETGAWKETVKASGGAACNANARQAATIEGEVVNSNEITGLNIYPNPAKDVLHIESGEEGILFIFGTDGAKVLEEKIQGHKQLVVGSLKSGLYLVRFKTAENQVFVKKLIVK